MRAVVRKNIDWFLNSEIMRPNDGFWGIAERLLITKDNAALDVINGGFEYQTQLTPDLAVLEHRRPDCNLQAALVFHLASMALNDAAVGEIPDRIIDFLLHRSSLWVRDTESPFYGLWVWALPHKRIAYYTDDMSWIIPILLLLGKSRGRADIIENATLCARSMYPHVKAYLDFKNQNGLQTPYPDGRISGLLMNPHWMGLATMAFAHADAYDPTPGYREMAQTYYDQYALGGPPAYDERTSKASAVGGLPWSLSEYAYLSLSASVCAEYYDMDSARQAARVAADTLISKQAATGHFPAEHYETPVAQELADLIYTQNFATLGLYHVARLFPEETRYQQAYEKSLAFLASIQDASDDVHFRGCWRGMYDTKTGQWGGGDHHEGGACSIYSGWTNAPICLTFLLELVGGSLFVGDTLFDPLDAS